MNADPHPSPQDCRLAFKSWPRSEQQRRWLLGILEEHAYYAALGDPAPDERIPDSALCRAQGERDAAREVLRSVEWDLEHSCPVCGGVLGEHDAGCKLLAALGGSIR